VSPRPGGSICGGREVGGGRELAVYLISWVPRTGVVINICCCIHVALLNGCANFVCLNETYNFFLHELPRNKGFWGVARRPVGTYDQKAHVFAFKDDRNMSAITVERHYRPVGGKGYLFADTDSGAACPVKC